MLKRVCLLLIMATGDLVLHGMTAEEYEEIKKRPSCCSKFGDEIWKELERKKIEIQKATFRTQEEYCNALKRVEELAIDLEQALVLSHNLDDLEQINNYKIKIKNKGIQSFFKRKRENNPEYVSSVVWNVLLHDLKKKKDSTCIILDDSIEFISIDDAVKYLSTLVNARRNIHKKFGFKLFYEGSSRLSARSESGDLTS